MLNHTIFRILSRLKDLESSGSGSTSELRPTINGHTVSVVDSAYIYDDTKGKAYYYDSNQFVAVPEAIPGMYRYDIVYITGNGTLTLRTGNELPADDYEGSAPEFPDRVIPVAIIRNDGITASLIDARSMVNFNNSKPVLSMGTLEFIIRT